MTRALAIVAGALAAATVTARAQARPNGRIMGVFGEVSFAPLVGAEITDLLNGTTALTTATGTISLAWLQQSTVLQVRRLGYRPRLLTITVSAADTGSLTVVLTPLATALPAVTTVAGPSPGEPAWKRNLVGFEDRRRSLGAPPSAFVTAKQIARWQLHYLSDIKLHNGRGVCDGLVYVNGAPIPGGVELTRFRGHFTLWGTGVSDGTHQTQVPAGVSPAAERGGDNARADAPPRPNTDMLRGRGSAAGGGYSTVADLKKFLSALRAGTIPGGPPPGIGVAGGAEGMNAVVDSDLPGGYDLIVLANYDPPAAERISRQVHVWLGAN